VCAAIAGRQRTTTSPRDARLHSTYINAIKGIVPRTGSVVTARNSPTICAQSDVVTHLRDG
jgi:hypothetical protein